MDQGVLSTCRTDTVSPFRPLHCVSIYSFTDKGEAQLSFPPGFIISCTELLLLMLMCCKFPSQSRHGGRLRLEEGGCGDGGKSLTAQRAIQTCYFTATCSAAQPGRQRKTSMVQEICHHPCLPLDSHWFLSLSLGRWIALCFLQLWNVVFCCCLFVLKKQGRANAPNDSFGVVTSAGVLTERD